MESFAPALEGKDAVLSSLGSFGSIFNPTTFYSESIHAIMEGMKRCLVLFPLCRLSNRTGRDFYFDGNLRRVIVQYYYIWVFLLHTLTHQVVYSCSFSKSAS